MCPLKKSCLDYIQECDPFLEDAVDSKSLLIENKRVQVVCKSSPASWESVEEQKNILHFTNFVLWRKNSATIMAGAGPRLTKDEPGTRNHGGDRQVHLEVCFFSTIIFLEQQLSQPDMPPPKAITIIRSP